MTLERLPSITDNVKPLRTEVTHEDALNVLVEIYAGCLHGIFFILFKTNCHFFNVIVVFSYLKD